MTQPPNESEVQRNKWSHLNQFERKYLKQAIQAYDQIMLEINDIQQITNYYQLTVDQVQRAKNYAFGEGVSLYQFSPDLQMAEAWNRMMLGEGTDIDEVLLRYEVLESELVINQGINQLDAHQLAQAQYPWSILINQR